MSNDFRSLLSVFHDATSTPSSSGGAASRNGQARRSNGGGDAGKGLPNEESSKDVTIDPTSTTDPSFSPSVLRERIDRLLRVRQIRRSAKSTAAPCSGSGSSSGANDGSSPTSFHVAICAIIVDDFPHESLWRKWMDETGGEVSMNDDHVGGNHHAVPGAGACKGDGDIDGKDDEKVNAEASDASTTVRASAEMYLHAKNPERVRSEWLR